MSFTLCFNIGLYLFEYFFNSQYLINAWCKGLQSQGFDKLVGLAKKFLTPLILNRCYIKPRIPLASVYTVHGTQWRPRTTWGGALREDISLTNQAQSDALNFNSHSQCADNTRSPHSLQCLNLTLMITYDGH